MLEAPGDDELRHTAPRAIGALARCQRSASRRRGGCRRAPSSSGSATSPMAGRAASTSVWSVRAQAATEMVFAPILARYADEFGRRRFLVAGPVICVVAVLLVALGVRPAQLGGARLLEGLGAAAFVPVALGHGRGGDVGRSSPPRGRQRRIRGVDADRLCGRVRARVGRVLRTPPRGVRPARGAVRLRGNRLPRLRSARPAAPGALAARRLPGSGRAGTDAHLPPGLDHVVRAHRRVRRQPAVAASPPRGGVAVADASLRRARHRPVPDRLDRRLPDRHHPVDALRRPSRSGNRDAQSRARCLADDGRAARHQPPAVPRHAADRCRSSCSASSGWPASAPPR